MDDAPWKRASRACFSWSAASSRAANASLLMLLALPKRFWATSVTREAVEVPGAEWPLLPKLLLLRPSCIPGRAASAKKSEVMVGAGSWRGCSITSE